MVEGLCRHVRLTEAKTPSRLIASAPVHPFKERLMSASQPQKLFGTTNELAKERNRAAAQRTLNTWIGSSLSFIGIGVTVDQIFRSLHQRFPSGDPTVTEITTYMTSTVFVGAGLMVLFLALIQHRLQIKTIEQEDYVLLSFSTLNRMIVATVLLFGCLGGISIVFLS